MIPVATRLRYRRLHWLAVVLALPGMALMAMGAGLLLLIAVRSGQWDLRMLALAAWSLAGLAGTVAWVRLNVSLLPSRHGARPVPARGWWWWLSGGALSALILVGAVFASAGLASAYPWTGVVLFSLPSLISVASLVYQHRLPRF